MLILVETVTGDSDHTLKTLSKSWWLYICTHIKIFVNPPPTNRYIGIYSEILDFSDIFKRVEQ